GTITIYDFKINKNGQIALATTSLSNLNFKVYDSTGNSRLIVNQYNRVFLSTFSPEFSSVIATKHITTNDPNLSAYSIAFDNIADLYVTLYTGSKNYDVLQVDTATLYSGFTRRFAVVAKF